MRAECRFLEHYWLAREVAGALLVLSLGLAAAGRLAGQERSKTSYLPGLDLGEQWQTTIDLGNLEEQQIRLVVSAYDRYGKSLAQGAGERYLAARATQRIEARRAFSPLSGTLKIESGGNHTAAVVIESLDGTKLEIIPAIQETSKDLVFPLLLSGDYSSKTLTVLNADSMPANLEIIALSQNGSELGRTSFPLLAPLATENLAVQRLFSSKTLEETAAVRIISGNMLAGLQTITSINGDLAGLTALTTKRQEWRFPIQTVAGSQKLWTTIGVFNAGEIPASIVVEGLDANNNSLGVLDRSTLSPAATYRFFPANIDSGTSAYPAVLRVTSDQPVSGYQTFAVKNGKGLTATLGIAGEDPAGMDFELMGSPDGSTLAVSHGAGAAQLRTEVWTESLRVSDAAVRANSTALQAAIALAAPIPLYYCEKLELGGEKAVNIQVPPGQTDTRCFKVYMPDRWGGKLTVKTTAGTIKELKFPDGSDYVNGSDTKLDKHGWYTFKIESDRSYTVSNTFIQEGTASTVPWNFFYFPFRDTEPRPQLYDNPGAYTKFDSKFNLGTASFDWEISHHKRPATAAGWEGHCWGSTLASVILQQPAAAGGFTQDELEGLGAEFFNEYGGTALFAELPFEKPTAAATDQSDPTVHKFHNGLREMLRTKKKAVQINLRQARDTGSAEVWNQGCYKYNTSLKEDPDAAGDALLERPFQIKFTTSFICNDDFVTPEDKTGVSTSNPQDFPNGRREQESTYILMYGGDGEVIPNGTIAGRKQNWLTMTLKHTFRQGDVNLGIFVPRSMFDVTGAATEFQNNNPGTNPFVTVTRLVQLGLKKNNGF
jgi:hypothetical protein